MARRSPAPGGLELVRAFINSLDIEDGTDDLGTPASAVAWLRGSGLATHGIVSEADRRRLVEVREALRELLAAREAGEPAAAAQRRLGRAARQSPLTVAFNRDGRAELVPAGAGTDAVIARLLGEVTAATTAGSWDRLKVCRNDACRWAFYDASKNHSGVWCSMAVCGNRFKGRTFRDRRGRAARAGSSAR
ncbi:MAG TPA: CGNR zinc finger domain-containing protein [Candidatus Deferrimicrobiaceae bacterium]|nr:CGNR zinc finger domain-containing protein [Candidatus Deferrimicrobiaceae bacterium]